MPTLNISWTVETVSKDLSVVDILGRFSAILSKVDTICEFLSALLYTELFWKSVWSKRIYSSGVNSFLIQNTLIGKGGKNVFDSCFHFKYAQTFCSACTCIFVIADWNRFGLFFPGCIPGRDFKSGENDAFWQNMRNNIERSRKFLLVITVSFLKRTYRELEEHQIMDTLLELYDQRPNDIITIQLTRSELMSMPRLPFQNIDALGSSFDWPTLRKLLIR